ncbi:MAG: serine hydroxymethyltransferase [Candidatus Dojkabacteria bacterium]|nr:serine hydroxymethyltransferase [Candidatus Dojkabacteria bacterium]
MTDKQILTLIENEDERQKIKLQLIPSENWTSKSVRDAVGSVLMHKYSEGSALNRYYEGNDIVDQIETLCIKRARKVFEVPDNWGINVQALAGSNANIAVYNALLRPGDKILSMYLPDGGHLSHGWSWPDMGLSGEKSKRVYKGTKKAISLVAKFYDIVQYKVNKESKLFDYDEIERIAKKEKPKLIISGGTAYPREIDYERLGKIAKSVGAYYLADIAHEAGLVAGRVCKNPAGIADVVTMTTHKTLRGPRGAIILSKKSLAKAVDRSVFPGIQGGPFDNNIAGIAVCLKEAMSKEFRRYAEQTVRNAQKLASELSKLGFDILTGGTDKHLILVDLRNKDLKIGTKGNTSSGRYIARALDHAGMTTNKNTVPFETGSAVDPSGIRIGTPTVTTRGMKENEMAMIAGWINQVVEVAKKYSSLEFEEFDKQISMDKEITKIRDLVKTLCANFTLE